MNEEQLIQDLYRELDLTVSATINSCGKEFSRAPAAILYTLSILHGRIQKWAQACGMSMEECTEIVMNGTHVGATTLNYTPPTAAESN